MAVDETNIQTLAQPAVVTNGSSSFLDFGLNFLSRYTDLYLNQKFTQDPGPQQNNTDTALGEQIANANAQAIARTQELLINYGFIGLIVIGGILLAKK